MYITSLFKLILLIFILQARCQDFVKPVLESDAGVQGLGILECRVTFSFAVYELLKVVIHGKLERYLFFIWRSWRSVLVSNSL